MSTVHDDLAAAQDALRGVQRRVRTLHGHFGDTVDFLRVRSDVERLAESLHLLQRTAPPAGTAGVTKLEVIPDGDYDRSFWADAEDEGLH